MSPTKSPDLWLGSIPPVISKMPDMTIPPQRSSPSRNALRSIKGSEMEVNNEIVAKAASATDTLERLTDRKKQTQ